MLDPTRTCSDQGEKGDKPFTRIAPHAKYAQLTMWTARVLSQCMVLEHMKEDDESRV